MYDVIFFHFPKYADFHDLWGDASGKSVPENMAGNVNFQDGSIFQASSFTTILFKKILFSALDVSKPELPKLALPILP